MLYINAFAIMDIFKLYTLWDEMFLEKCFIIFKVVNIILRKYLIYIY